MIASGAKLSFSDLHLHYIDYLDAPGGISTQDKHLLQSLIRRCAATKGEIKQLDAAMVRRLLGVIDRLIEGDEG